MLFIFQGEGPKREKNGTDCDFTVLSQYRNNINRKNYDRCN